MLKQPPPKASKAKEQELPEFSPSELERMLDPNAVHQEILRMRAKGLSPSQRGFHALAANPVEADVTDAVKWQDNKNEELKNLDLQQTIEGPKPWVQDLREDFIAFDIATSNTTDETRIILKELAKELDKKLEAGGGPDARNYITGLKRDLAAIIEKL